MEAYTTDGPFERAQDYLRLNVFGKASSTIGETIDWSVWTSYLDSNWFASGQVPVRAVREGLITRFGAIDDSEGGNTLRFNGNFDVRWRPSENDTLKVHGYGQYYQLEPLLQLHVLPRRPRERRPDQADRHATGPSPVLDVLLRASLDAVRNARHRRGGLSVPRGHAPRGPGPHAGPAAPGPHAGREHLRDVLLAPRQVRPRAHALAPDRDRRARRHLQLQRQQQPDRRPRSAQRQRDPGDPERQVQRHLRALVRDRALRQLRHRLSQQRRARRRAGPEPARPRPGDGLGVRRAHEDPAQRGSLVHLLVAQPHERARLRRRRRARSSRATRASGPVSSSC